MASQLQVKSKIRATANIKQITRAMEMVAATKMRKAEIVALAARPYAKEALLLLGDMLRFARAEELLHASKLMRQTREERTCLVVVTSDRGLCGAYNNAVLRMAYKYMQEHKPAGLVTVGKKAVEFFERRGAKSQASFFQFSDIANLEDASEMADFLLSSFLQGTYDEILVCSTDFISALRQKVGIKQVLPLDLVELQQIIAGIVPKRGKYAEIHAEREQEDDVQQYLVEPSPQEVFDKLAEELVRVEILHLIFEANASEHSSRMVAMKNATENAESMIESLTRELNKARQAAITQELAEVTTAKEALTAE